MTRLRQLAWDVWILIKGYWGSEERWSARLLLLYLVVAVLRVYLDQTLQLRWRRWLTDQYVTRWLANRTFYRMRFSGRVDNPDQRISEDVRLFIQRSMFLGLGFLNSLATLASFAARSEER